MKQIVLLLGDGTLMYLALFVSLLVRHGNHDIVHFKLHAILFLPLFALWIVINYINGLYDLGHGIRAKRLIETGLLAFGFGVLYFYLTPALSLSPKTILALTVVFGTITSFGWHTTLRLLSGSKKRRIPILFFGYSSEVEAIIEYVNDRPHIGYEAKYLFIPDESPSPQTSLTVVRTLEEVFRLIEQGAVRLVAIHDEKETTKAVQEKGIELLFSSVAIIRTSTLFEQFLGKIAPSHSHLGWFLANLKPEIDPLYTHARGVLDVLLVVILGLFFIIAAPIIALLIRLSSSGPIFFKQERVGKDGRIFTMIKFRSMLALSSDGSAEVNGAQFAKKNDSRTTRIGAFLRKTRLDELPQLFNLIRGEITLIGPRPERPEIVRELERKLSYYPLRHMVKPGLMSWAMIHQDYTDTVERSLEKVQYDLYYIAHRSLFLDLSILLKTVEKIIRLKGQ